MIDMTQKEYDSENDLNEGIDLSSLKDEGTENAPQIVVLYHDNCLDGFGAAYAAWKALGDTAIYIPVQYSNPTPLPDVNIIFGKEVYVLDFSYKADQIVELESWVKKLVIIDHHSGALTELMKACNDLYFLDKQLKSEGKLDTPHCYNYIYSPDECGAVLTWHYFADQFPGSISPTVPQLLLHIQDGDLGYLWNDPDHCLPGSAEIRGALGCKAIVPRNFATWNMLISDWFHWHEELVNDGATLSAAHKGRCAELAELAYPCQIRWYLWGEAAYIQISTGLAINATGEFANELGNQFAAKSGTFGAVWNYLGAGKYKVSLRSIGDFDVSAIARYYGGNGHKNAAGFVVDRNKGQKLREILQDISGGNHETNG